MLYILKYCNIYNISNEIIKTKQKTYDVLY
jgi:hypothetical protein